MQDKKETKQSKQSWSGSIIEDYNPEQDKVYSLFTEYFENISMTKIKDVGSYSMYMAKIQAYLGIEFRYLIAFVPKDVYPVRKIVPLTALKWVSLQTRTLEDDHDIQPQAYRPRRMKGLDQGIKLVRKSDKEYIYEVEDLPISICLLPKSTGLEYNSTGSVVVALETYQTIVTINLG